MEKMINTLRAVVMFTLLLFVLIFCFQNRQEVNISFLKMEIAKLPLFIALIGTLATGLLIGFLAGMIKGTRAKRDVVRTKAQQERKVESKTTDLERRNNTEA